MSSPLKQALIAAVKSHASNNYAKGWDVVVESWDEVDIAAAIGDAQTVPEAIAAVAADVSTYTDYANDIRAEVDACCICRQSMAVCVC